MQLGFVIDHSRCIGCHACTVACKSENNVPLGDFRTWVKYTEAGSFPEVRRSFAVLRCNQCTTPSCVHICPVNALEKKTNGIVDNDPNKCIGCKSCMQACPYDALYINESTGIAEKCHFCAHRVEVGLAPACAVVCPTEAIIPGDFHDPQSRVSQMRGSSDLAARKVETGNGPNVFYKEAHPAGLDPNQTNLSGGFIWANQLASPQLEAQKFEALITDAEARATEHPVPQATSRTVLDVPRKPLWGWKISNYLFTKSLAAGIFLVGALVMAPYGDALSGPVSALIPALAIFFLAATMGLLVGDLKRPDRFLLVLTNPNWTSWLCKGSVIITAYGGFLALWTILALCGIKFGGFWGGTLLAFTAVTGLLTAIYTAWLFGQAKGRVLWLKRGLTIHLAAQALVAGGGFLLALHWAVDLPQGATEQIARALTLGLVGHAACTLLEGRAAPKGRAIEYQRAVRLITDGPYAKRHWWLGVTVGIVVPLVGLIALQHPTLWALCGVAALIGLWTEEDIYIKAGQALPIS
jgi:Fe-S-cluster-containing dehydrogenase component